VHRPLRLLADQAFARTAGAPLVEGNAVRLLKDGCENYPCWLDAIKAARHFIHFETYILHDDKIGRVFAEALADAARRGVKVRLLVDWFGNMMKTSPKFWRTLRNAGVEARSFGYPSINSPLGWISRDHRKSLVIDGRTAFVSGLCVGDDWTDDGHEAQRDTGVMISGPAVADVDAAFAEAWATTGSPVPIEELVPQNLITPAGDVALRVIATMPSSWGVFKLDQLVASVARETLWVTDAYFVGVTAYVNALIAAARDGVDVRLLVPGTVDVFGVGAMSRAGYRALLEGGVRIFEWNGVMLHAKTAVADGRWARVGSTNANINSWWGNWELDVAIEDENFGRQMTAMYENDLANSTEVVLTARRMHSVERRRRPRLEDWKAHGRSTRRAATAGAIRMGRTFGAVLTARREVGAAEAYSLFWSSLIFLAVGAVALQWPKAIAYPFGVLGLWFALVGLYRAGKLYYEHRSEVQPETTERRDPEQQKRVV
jgi:cardiolipin synthase